MKFKFNQILLNEKGNSISIVQHKNEDEKIIVQEIGLNISQGNGDIIINFNSLDSLIEALTKIKKDLK